jgi:hypothetical protein
MSFHEDVLHLDAISDPQQIEQAINNRILNDPYLGVRAVSLAPSGAVAVRFFRAETVEDGWWPATCKVVKAETKEKARQEASLYLTTVGIVNVVRNEFFGVIEVSGEGAFAIVVIRVRENE